LEAAIIKETLEAALAKIDPTPPTRASIIGEWSLKDAPQIAEEVLNLLAKRTSWFDTYQKFLSRFGQYQEKPIKPDPNDIQFDPPGQTYPTDLHETVARLARHNQAQNAHQTTLSEYQTQAAISAEIRSNFDYSIEGYLGYCHAEISKLAQASSDPEMEEAFLFFFARKRKLPIAESAARLGTFIVGNHGSGKSEIIKQRVWHYLNQPKAKETLIVIDPHGELASEVARMKPNLTNDRLVLFDPFLSETSMPCMSVLNSASKSDSNIQTESEAYGAALEMVAGEEMSPNMTALCERAAHIILEKDDFNILDLMKLVNTSPPKRGQPDNPYPEAYNYAAEKSINPIIREFFQSNFLYGNFAQAKNGLSERITRVITSPIAQKILLNPPSLDFQKLVEQRKLIVVSLPMAKLGDQVTRMLGQMIVAQIQLAVLKRDLSKIDKYPQVHLFMDEAHHFVSQNTAKQIDELRKFKLSLTLATQYIDKFPKSILESVKGLGVQMAGYCAGNNLAEMNKVFGFKKAPPSKPREQDESLILNRLPVGNFHFKVRGTKGVPNLQMRQFTTETNLLFNEPKWRKRNAGSYMTDQEWEQSKRDQLGSYYREVAAMSFKPNERQHETVRAKGQPKVADELPPLKPNLGYD
jgi:hypothetical protein